jgi:hypothetical protein
MAITAQEYGGKVDSEVTMFLRQWRRHRHKTLKRDLPLVSLYIRSIESCHSSAFETWSPATLVLYLFKRQCRHHHRKKNGTEMIFFLPRASITDTTSTRVSWRSFRWRGFHSSRTVAKSRGKVMWVSCLYGSNKAWTQSKSSSRKSHLSSIQSANALLNESFNQPLRWKVGIRKVHVPSIWRTEWSTANWNRNILMGSCCCTSQTRRRKNRATIECTVLVRNALNAKKSGAKWSTWTFRRENTYQRA